MIYGLFARQCNNEWRGNNAFGLHNSGGQVKPKTKIEEKIEIEELCMRKSMRENMSGGGGEGTEVREVSAKESQTWSYPKQR